MDAHAPEYRLTRPRYEESRYDVDNDLTRRGTLTANGLWGNHRVNLLGGYLSGCSALMTARTGNLRAMETFSQFLSQDLARRCYESRETAGLRGLRSIACTGVVC